jgi:hypothetical protein
MGCEEHVPVSANALEATKYLLVLTLCEVPTWVSTWLGDRESLPRLPETSIKTTDYGISPGIVTIWRFRILTLVFVRSLPASDFSCAMTLEMTRAANVSEFLSSESYAYRPRHCASLNTDGMDSSRFSGIIRPETLTPSA